MRKMRWLQGAFALAVALVGPSALAADHLDSPAVKADAAADITDVYAWAEGEKLLLVLNVSPLATAESKFSDAVQYALHVESGAAYPFSGMTTKKDVVCTFDAAQAIQCWVGDPGGKVDDSVKGDASAAAGLASDSGKIKVFAGLRADPFYFNLAGFQDAVSTVKGALATDPLPFTVDGSGCPGLDAFTATALIQQLQGTNMGAGAAENFFGAVNVLSIVLEIDKALLTGGGNTVAVWGSTHQAGG